MVFMMVAQKAEAVQLAKQLASEIEQLRARCAELEERARAELEGAADVRLVSLPRAGLSPRNARPARFDVLSFWNVLRLGSTKR